MKDKNSYSIYKFTFPDGKIYIRQTKQLPKERWQEGNGYKGQKVYEAIIQNGWENIEKEILHTNLSAQEANELEQYYIQHFNAFILAIIVLMVII